MSSSVHPERSRGARAALSPYLRELLSEPAIAVCASSALLVVSHYQGSTNYFAELAGDRFDQFPARGALAYFWWFGGSLVLFGLFPLVLATLTRGGFHRAYGLGLGDWRAGLKIAGLFLAVMLPAAYLASTFKTFEGAYPLAGQAAYQLRVGDKLVVSRGLFAAYEAGYFFYFIGWEFLFRGYLLNACLPRLGRLGALLIGVGAFATMHLGKVEPEALGSIVAALALGVLALRTRSIWYGVLIHGTIAVWMDWLSVRSYL